MAAVRAESTGVCERDLFGRDGLFNFGLAAGGAVFADCGFGFADCAAFEGALVRDGCAWEGFVDADFLWGADQFVGGGGGRGGEFGDRGDVGSAGGVFGRTMGFVVDADRGYSLFDAVDCVCDRVDHDVGNGF